MDNNNQRRNRIKQWLRIRLGILQMIHMPILNILFAPIVILVVAIWKVKDKVFAMIDIPQILLLIQVDDELIPIDYDGWIEKAEQAEMVHLGEHIRNKVPEAAE